MHVSASTPDVVVVNEESKLVFVLELACMLLSSLEEAFITKVIKYQTIIPSQGEVIQSDYLFSYLATLEAKDILTGWL